MPGGIRWKTGERKEAAVCDGGNGALYRNRSCACLTDGHSFHTKVKTSTEFPAWRGAARAAEHQMTLRLPFSAGAFFAAPSAAARNFAGKRKRRRTRLYCTGTRPVLSRFCRCWFGMVIQNIGKSLPRLPEKQHRSRAAASLCGEDAGLRLCAPHRKGKRNEDSGCGR